MLASLLQIAALMIMLAIVVACPGAQEMAIAWCNNQTLSRCPATPGPLVPLRSGSAGSAVQDWRCYSPACLTPNRSAYRGGGCTAYCTRDSELKWIESHCSLPPTPPPAPPPIFSNATEVFTPGELGYPCIRIPSISLAPDGTTLNAFAECRNFTGDGCYPLAPPPPRDSNRDICQKRSLDGGKTWSILRVIARNGAQANPVNDNRGKIVLQYMQLSPSDTMQMESRDNGATWSSPRSVCKTLPKEDCGGAVGPGTGIRLRSGPHAGRLLFIGHFGAYVRDAVWFSDDDGETFTASSTQLLKMDEAQLVELPDGTVLANMRNSHANKSCLCRATARSQDGGTTWSSITYDPTLTSPVCAGSVLRNDQQVFFANPSSTTSRSHGVIRRSMDGVHWVSSKLIWPGAYAYSCLTETPDVNAVGVLWETDGPQCRDGSESCRTVFSTVPADF